MKFAVIETDGKQYLVKPGDKLRLDTIPGEKGVAVRFDKVLLAGSEDSAQVGAPYVAGLVVEGKILSSGRADKVLVMKYHNKTRYRRKRGHRQHYTEVEITKV